LIFSRSIRRILIAKGIDFSRETGYKRIYLWTFQGLDQAQSIYEQNGFRISEERDVKQWGDMVREQRFELFLNPDGSEEE
jgi:hypothetical protein